jgi:dipeptidyl aminopeptidase/acylaminoacyl peptidase
MRTLPLPHQYTLALLLVGCSGAQHAPATRGARAPYAAAQLAEVVDFTSVAVSPDGSEVAFVTDRTGSFELWTLARGEHAPRQRTHANEDVSGLAYSPDGSMLAFEIDHGGDERPDLWLLRRGGSETPERLTNTQTAEQSVRFSPDGRSIAFESDPDRPFRFNVHVMDLATHAVRQLTHEPINVQHARWSRDGRTIVATRSGDDQQGDLLVIDVATGTQRAIAPPRRDGILVAVGFRSDGVLVALATNAQGFMQLANVDLATGRAEYVGPGDWDVESADLADDGTILVDRNVHGQSEVSLSDASIRAPRVITREGVVGALAIAHDGSRVAMLHEASNHPTEVLAAGRDGVAETLVPPDVAGVDATRLARAERRTMSSFDGRPLDVFVWHPPVSRLGEPPPLVVHVHGGPNGQTRGAFSPQIQALAEAGFVVASVNYRGSTGYGRAFEDLNNRDWGGGDLRDIVHVVQALATTHEIDGARVGIMGGSYGGYMTLRAITAAPEVWHAAVDSFGMPDLEEDYRITADRFGSWYLTEMGDPVRDVALYRDRSPIHTLDRVRAPLLVLQGANDTNVPRTESDEVVAALRARHSTVDYVVYPGEGHGFTHRDHRIDAMTRTVEFFRSRLGATSH